MNFLASRREFLLPVRSFQGRLHSYHFKLPAYRLRLVKKHSWLELLLSVCLVLYAILCIIIYFQYVAPWIAGESDARIGADSDRFWDYAKTANSSDDIPLISLTGNFVGPVAMVEIFHTGFAIMCFNFLLLLVTLKIVSSIPRVNKTLVGFLFLANAELLPALTTLNKEIFALMASVLAVKYLYSKTRSYFTLLLVIFVSVIARWEQAAIFLLYLVLDRILFRGKPILAVLSLIFAITVFYPFAFQLLGLSADSLDWLIQGDTTASIDKLQRSFGFPLVVVPKIFFLLTGQLHSLEFYNSDRWWKIFAVDPQNMLFLPLACLMSSILFVLCICTKRMSLKKPLPLLIMVSLIVTAVTPFTQPRYIYGVYTMLCILIAQPKDAELV